MTIITAKKNNTDFTINSTTWTEVISDTWTQNKDTTEEYIIFIYAEFTISDKNEDAQIRVMTDGVEEAISIYTPTVASQFTSFSTIIMQSAELGIHTIAIQGRGTNAADTVTVRRKRMVVMKH